MRAASVLAAALAVILGLAGATPPTGGAQLVRPNFVLIVTDDQDAGSIAQMPFTFGRSDWIRFDNAYLNVSLCCPSRATILTGQYDHHTGVLANGHGSRFRDTATIATWLQAAGYSTALIGKYLNSYPWRKGETYLPPGWTEWHAFKGDTNYYNYTLNENGTLRTYGTGAENYSTDVFASKAVAFVNAQTGPFFLFVNPFAPHSPWTPAPRHATAFTGVPVPHSPNFNEADVSDKPAWVKKLPLAKESSVDNSRRKAWRTLLAVDDLVRQLFDALAAKGVLDNTVFVITSDNGFSYGEHRYTKKNCEYEECMRAPLFIRYPGQAGRSETRLAQVIDIAPTFVELAGASATIPIDGRSLVPLLENRSTAWRDGVLMHYSGLSGSGSVPAFWGIRRADGWKYVELKTGEKELYNLNTDPYELDNLAGNPAYAAVQSELAAQLAALKQ